MARADHRRRGRSDADQHLRVDLLGTLRLRGTGRDVPLPAGKTRVLLACLASQRGPVSIDRLVEELWLGYPPKDPRHALENHISRLRQALRRAGADDVIVSCDGGYQLRNVATDVDEFEDLVAAGRRTLSCGDPVAALETLARADRLWGGDPFDGLTGGSTLDAERVRLEGVRRRAQDARFDAAIAGGASSAVVEELSVCVREDPLDERRRGQLMLALYRSGRQSEALRVFAEGSDHLAEELGVDPGPDLQRLHLAILRQDPDLETTAGGSMPPAVENAVPASGPADAAVPRPRTSFVGRDEDVAEVLDRLRPGSLVTLTGIGGCGKTRLAIEVARTSAARFSDGVVFVDLAAVSDGATVVTAAVRATVGLGGGAAASVAPVDALVGSLLGRSTLVILDNCEHVLAACAALADRLLDDAPTVTLLATSREPLGVEGEQRWHVEPLATRSGTGGDPDALVLVRDRVRAVRPDVATSARHRETLLRIAERLDGLPLALELAAARMDHLSPADVADRLDDRFALLSTSTPGASRARTLEATLDWSHGLLDVEEQRLLRRLAVFATAFDLDAAHAVGHDGLERDTVDVLGSLVRRSLVVAAFEDDGARYRLLETVRLFAAEKLAASPEKEDVRQRHRDWYVAWVERLPWDARLLDPRIVREIERRYEDLRVALEFSVAQHRLDLAARLACALTGVFAFQVGTGEAERWLGGLLRGDHGELSEELRAEVEVHYAFVANHRFGGDAAWFRELARRTAAAISHLPADARAAALGWWSLAGFEHALDFDTDHLDRYSDEVIRRCRRHDAPLLESYAHIVKAQARMYDDELEEAAAELDRAAALSVSAMDHQFEMLALERAIVQYLLGRTEIALRLVDDAERTSRGPYWRHLIAVARAVCLASGDDAPGARAMLNDAWVGTSRAPWQHPMAAFDCVLGLAAVEAHAGDHERAAELLAVVRGDDGVRVSLPMLMGLYLRCRDDVRARLDSETRRRAIDAGSGRDPHRVLSDAARSHETVTGPVGPADVRAV